MALGYQAGQEGHKEEEQGDPHRVEDPHQGEEEGLQGKPGEAAWGEAQGQGGAQEDQGRKGGQGEEVLAEAQADEGSGQDLGRGAGSGAKPLNPA